MSQTKAQLVGGVGFSTADSLTVHNGLAVTGVVTATSFAGNISGDATGLTGSPNITVTNITASGNVTVGGTLTYEDVTNIDAIGIVTARSGINITGAGMTVTGISTFRGDVQVADKIIHLDDSNTAIRFPAADTFTVETGGSERIRVGAAGSVGIGSDDPKAALDVTGDQSAGYQAQFTNSSGSNRARIYVDGNGVALVSENFNNGFEVASNTARIYANGSERLRIDSNGNVLVAKSTTALTTAGSRLSSGFVSLSGDSNSTNLAANAGGALSLANVDSTDNNFSNIGGYNSNGLVVSQIDFINKSHSSRTGDIAFLTHNGSAMSEKMRITSGGGIHFNNGELIERVNVTSGKLSDNTNIDLEDGMMHLFTTTETTTATPNIRISSSTSLNDTMATGDAISVTIVTTAAAAGYAATVNIDGATVGTNGGTLNWTGGSAPSDGGSSGVDIYAYTIMKTASATYTVIATQTKTS